MSASIRVFFATDIHGSSLCFRKFLNAVKTDLRPDVLILGADITGKQLVHLVAVKPGCWEAYFQGSQTRLDGEAAVRQYEEMLANTGAYSIRCEPDVAAALVSDRKLLDETTRALIIGRLVEWVEIADKRLRGLGKIVLVNGGNDDPWYIDEVLDSSQAMLRAEGRTVELGLGYVVISTGYANLTPWGCPRDVSEAELWRVICSMAESVQVCEKCLFNFHCPPFGTALDSAVKLDKDLRGVVSFGGPVMESVGSRAVRAAVEKYQPAVGLHGHIHEQHAFQVLGRTMCFNPGSEYAQGLLNGLFLEFGAGKLMNWALIRER